MFDDGAMPVPAPDLAALRQLGDRVRPLSAALERTLPVPEALAELLPQGGLVRGSTVATGGSAASSLALALAGPATAAGSWCAVVGVRHLGLLAAAELGVVLERTLLVAEPPAHEWAATVAALLDAVEVVLVAPERAPTPTVHRRLVARARERGAVLLWVDAEVRPGGALGASTRAEQPDVTVVGGTARWEGIGRGHGRLRARQLEVTVSGRRAAVRPRRAELWLPGPDGAIALASPVGSASSSVGSASPPPPRPSLREVG